MSKFNKNEILVEAFSKLLVDKGIEQVELLYQLDLTGEDIKKIINTVSYALIKAVEFNESESNQHYY